MLKVSPKKKAGHAHKGYPYKKKNMYTEMLSRIHTNFNLSKMFCPALMTLLELNFDLVPTAAFLNVS